MAMTRGQFASLLAPGLRSVFQQYFVNHYLTSNTAWFIVDKPKQPNILHACRNCGDVFISRPKYNLCPHCKVKLTRVEI